MTARRVTENSWAISAAAAILSAVFALGVWVGHGPRIAEAQRITGATYTPFVAMTTYQDGAVVRHVALNQFGDVYLATGLPVAAAWTHEGNILDAVKANAKAAKGRDR